MLVHTVTHTRMHIAHTKPGRARFAHCCSGAALLTAGLCYLRRPSAADMLFNSAGRFVVRDQGAITILFRILLKAFDLNLFW